MLNGIAGRIVMVTGGATGIGKAITTKFACEGALVACCYNKSGDSAKELSLELGGNKVFPVKLNVMSIPEIPKAIEKIKEYFKKPVSILVNNAGNVVKTVTMEELTQEIWEEIINLNLSSVVWCSKYCIPDFKAQGYGRIINISSLAARAGGGPGQIPYAISKGGVETFTRGLAKEMGPYNITVNAIAPGVIMTKIHETFKDIAGDLDEFAQRTPLKRLGYPEDISGAAVFLASLEASYITGITLSINGGARMD